MNSWFWTAHLGFQGFQLGFQIGCSVLVLSMSLSIGPCKIVISVSLFLFFYSFNVFFCSKIAKQAIKDFYIYSCIIFELGMVLFWTFIRKVLFFSSFLIFFNALPLSLRNFSISLAYLCKSSFDVSEFFSFIYVNCWILLVSQRSTICYLHMCGILNCHIS